MKIKGLSSSLLKVVDSFLGVLSFVVIVLVGIPAGAEAVKMNLCASQFSAYPTTQSLKLAIKNGEAKSLADAPAPQYLVEIKRVRAWLISLKTHKPNFEARRLESIRKIDEKIKSQSLTYGEAIKIILNSLATFKTGSGIYTHSKSPAQVRIAQSNETSIILEISFHDTTHARENRRSLYYEISIEKPIVFVYRVEQSTFNQLAETMLPLPVNTPNILKGVGDQQFVDSFDSILRNLYLWAKPVEKPQD